MGYKTHLLEIYTLPTTLASHFFYLCYSLKPIARGEWLRYISEGWRDFLLSIDPKSEAVRSYSFSGHRSGPPGEPRDRCGKAAGGCLAGTSFRGTFPDAGETFCRELTKSRKLSGGNIFSGYISERWRDFLLSIDLKPKAVWREYFFEVHFRRLVGLFAEDLPKAGGGLA